MNRPTVAALDYVVMTIAGRGAVFVALLIAALVLPVGAYASFALAYQTGLFVAYNLAFPLNVAGYRQGAVAHPIAIVKRISVTGLIGGIIGGVAGAALIPGAGWELVVATGVYAAASSMAVVGMGEAQGYGRARSFARWNAVGSLGFVAVAAIAQTPSAELLAATAAMLVAPLALLARVGAVSSPEGNRPIGRPSFIVFAANLFLSVTRVIFLVLVTQRLNGKTADDVALQFTLLQAALLVPMQFAWLMQPRLIMTASQELEEEFFSTQATLALSMMALATIAAAAAVLAGWTSWSVLGPMAASVIPVSLGYAGMVLLVARGVGARLLAGPAAFALGLAAWGLLAGAHASASTLTAGWALAATIGVLVQSTVAEDRRNLSLVLRAILGAGGCLALGEIHPALAAGGACLILALSRIQIRDALVASRAVLASHR